MFLPGLNTVKLAGAQNKASVDKCELQTYAAIIVRKIKLEAEILRSQFLISYISNLIAWSTQTSWDLHCFSKQNAVIIVSIIGTERFSIKEEKKTCVRVFDRWILNYVSAWSSLMDHLEPGNLKLQMVSIGM